MTRTAILKIFVFAVLLAMAVTPSFAQSKKDKDQAKKLELAGDTSFAAKNYADAADKYGQSLGLVATNAQAHYRKGFAQFELKQYEPALSEFALALTQGFRPIDVYRVR